MADVRSELATRGKAVVAVLETLSPTDPDGNTKLGDVARRLVAMRDELIAARRAGASCDDELRRVNAIISSIFGVEFPSGGLQWQRVCDTRDALRRLLSDIGAEAAASAA